MEPKFNPSSSEYKKVEDLPQEHQAGFADVGGDFVKEKVFETDDVNLDDVEKRSDSGIAVKTNQEMEQLNLESIKSKNDKFLKKFWREFGKTRNKKIESTPILVDPRSQDYEALVQEEDKSRFGEYTLNPEMLRFTEEDLKSMVREGKLKIEELPAVMKNKEIYEVAQYVMDTYGATHYVPGVELWKLIAEITKIEEKEENDSLYIELSPLKYTSENYLFGSLIRDTDGSWCVPFLSNKWTPRLSADTRELTSGLFGRQWSSSGDRVLLFEK